MRNIICLLFTLLGVLGSCSDRNDPKPRNEKLNWLATGTWQADHVTNSVDGNLTFAYQTFRIAFIRDESNGYDGDYMIVNGKPAFTENSGKWKLDDDLDKIILNGRTIDARISSDVLELHFSVTPSGGRTDGLTGNYTFVLRRVN